MQRFVARTLWKSRENTPNVEFPAWHQPPRASRFQTPLQNQTAFRVIAGNCPAVQSMPYRRRGLRILNQRISPISVPAPEASEAFRDRLEAVSRETPKRPACFFAQKPVVQTKDSWSAIKKVSPPC